MLTWDAGQRVLKSCGALPARHQLDPTVIRFFAGVLKLPELYQLSPLFQLAACG